MKIVFSTYHGSKCSMSLQGNILLKRKKKKEKKEKRKKRKKKK